MLRLYYLMQDLCYQERLYLADAIKNEMKGRAGMFWKNLATDWL